MKLLFILLCTVAAASASIFSMTIHNTGSIRAKMIREGTYQQFLEKQHLRKAQHLATSNQPFYDYIDDLYLGNISIGTPSQALMLVLDTGSSNLWAIDIGCTSLNCEGARKHRFDTSKSSTYQSENTPFSIQYGLGYCSGHLAKDTINMAGLVISVQELGIATNLDVDLGLEPIDGILGLGWPQLAVDNVIPPMQNLLPQLDKPLFTVWLDRKIAPAIGGKAGLITYGAIDTSNCAAQVNYVPLTKLLYWQFAINSFNVGTYTDSTVYQVMSDTGTWGIGAPTPAFHAIVKQIGAKYTPFLELYTVPCSSMKTLPSLTLTISGIQYSIPSIEYVLDLSLGNGQCAVTFFDMGPIDSMGFPSWILGDTFIRTFCNVYDIGNKQIGFAQAKHNI